MSFLVSVRAGPYTIRGVSLGGVYTSLAVPELSVMFDAGIPLRQHAAIDDVLISHGHADHVGGLVGWLGLRGLNRRGRARVFAPPSVAKDLEVALTAMSRLQRYDLSVDFVPMEPGDDVPLSKGNRVRAFRTHHTVPSLGYQIYKAVPKLKPEFLHLPGHEIARRKDDGEALFDVEERLELAYATDTLSRVLETSPSILKSRVLVLECTFLDDQKSRAESRAGCHIHLDDLIEERHAFENAHLVLMHFSQIYNPDDVQRVLAEKLPESLRARVLPFLPSGRYWPY